MGFEEWRRVNWEYYFSVDQTKNAVAAFRVENETYHKFLDEYLRDLLQDYDWVIPYLNEMAIEVKKNDFFEFIIHNFDKWISLESDLLNLMEKVSSQGTEKQMKWLLNNIDDLPKIDLSKIEEILEDLMERSDSLFEFIFNNSKIWIDSSIRVRELLISIEKIGNEKALKWCINNFKRLESKTKNKVFFTIDALKNSSKFLHKQIFNDIDMWFELHPRVMNFLIELDLYCDDMLKWLYNNRETLKSLEDNQLEAVFLISNTNCKPAMNFLISELKLFIKLDVDQLQCLIYFSENENAKAANWYINNLESGKSFDRLEVSKTVEVFSGNNKLLKNLIYSRS